MFMECPCHGSIYCFAAPSASVHELSRTACRGARPRNRHRTCVRARTWAPGSVRRRAANGKPLTSPTAQSSTTSTRLRRRRPLGRAKRRPTTSSRARPRARTRWPGLRSRAGSCSTRARPAGKTTPEPRGRRRIPYHDHRDPRCGHRPTCCDSTPPELPLAMRNAVEPPVRRKPGNNAWGCCRPAPDGRIPSRARATPKRAQHMPGSDARGWQWQTHGPDRRRRAAQPPGRP